VPLSSSTVVLPAVPESAAAARRSVAAHVDPGDTAETVALLVSELVTVSLREGELGPADTITIHTDPVEHGVRVTVCDSAVNAGSRHLHGGAVEVHRHGGPGGLGLKIVARLARRWGVTSPYPDARAWFEVDADGA
jgi:hypothetical protein